MAIEWVELTAWSGAPSLTSFNFSKPAALQAGDVLFIISRSANHFGGTQNVPWVKFTGSSTDGYAMYRVVTDPATEPATYTNTFSSANSTHAAYLIRGVDPANPVQAFTQAGGASTPVSVAGPVNPNDGVARSLLTFVTPFNSSQVVTISSASSSVLGTLTPRYNLGGQVRGNRAALDALAVGQQPGTVTWSCGTVNGFGIAAILLNPVPAAAAGPTLRQWDGAALAPVTAQGWWDGAAVQPVTVQGWWDGTAVQPLA